MIVLACTLAVGVALLIAWRIQQEREERRYRTAMREVDARYLERAQSAGPEALSRAWRDLRMMREATRERTESE